MDKGAEGSWRLEQEEDMEEVLTLGWLGRHWMPQVGACLEPGPRTLNPVVHVHEQLYAVLAPAGHIFFGC